MLIAASSAIVENEPLLTQLDQATGDGDHGACMKLGFSAVQKMLTETSAFQDSADLLTQVGSVLINAAGGASGLLFGTLFISGARKLERKNEMTGMDWALFLHAGTEAIQRRGRAEPGDKTMLDALFPAADGLYRAASAGEDLARCLQQAADCAQKGAEATKSMRARVGRAWAYADASIGHPDAGAVSSAILIASLAHALIHSPHG